MFQKKMAFCGLFEEVGKGMRMCSQKVRRIEVIRLSGDEANQHN